MFSSDEVNQLIKELDVLVVKADFTDGNPAIQKDLDKSNRKSLPVNIIYPRDPDSPAIMMPESLSPQDVIKALRIAAQ
ncbi:MAG: hypothetical protein ACSHX0_10865 [Akkermansiaceae bacterium]